MAISLAAGTSLLWNGHTLVKTLEGNHVVWISLARGDCIGWGHLFLSARLTQCLRGKDRAKVEVN